MTIESPSVLQRQHEHHGAGRTGRGSNGRAKVAAHAEAALHG